MTNASSVATGGVLRRPGVAVALLTVVVFVEENRAVAAHSAAEHVRALGAGTALAIALALPTVLALALIPDILDRLRRRSATIVMAAPFAAAAAFAMHSVVRGSARHEARALLLAAVTFLVVLASGAAALSLLARVRTARPALVMPLGLVVGVAAFAANHTLYPRLYAQLHIALAIVIVIACAVAADGALLLAERWRSTRLLTRVVATFGGAAAVSFVTMLPREGVALAECAVTRHALHEQSELLRPVVKMALRWWPPPPVATKPVADPLAAPRAGEELDLRGRDVLLITVDALRADHVGAYGYHRPTTPFLDALARDSVLFRYAYTAAPQSPYALTSMMTGKHVRVALDLDGPEHGDVAVTWADLFAESGYATAAFYPETIFFTDAARFKRFSARQLGFRDATVEYGNAWQRAERVIAHVSAAPADARLFVWSHVFEPHEPYERVEGIDFGDRDVDRYDAEIALADRAIEKMVSGVRAVRPDTVVIITADHGEAFGEHQAQFHGTTLYEEQTRVPLVISVPGVAARVVDTTVQTLDLLPTFARAIGAKVPGTVRGRTLGPLINGTADDAERGVAYASLPDVTMLAVGHERVMCTHTIAACALFDVRADPAQARPISDVSRLGAAVDLLRAATRGNRASVMRVDGDGIN